MLRKCSKTDQRRIKDGPKTREFLPVSQTMDIPHRLQGYISQPGGYNTLVHHVCGAQPCLEDCLGLLRVGRRISNTEHTKPCEQACMRACVRVCVRVCVHHITHAHTCADLNARPLKGVSKRRN